MSDKKRTGSCRKCGNCCRELRFFFPYMFKADPVFMDFYEARGCEITDSAPAGMIAVIVPHKCPQLGDGNLCKLQKRKPKACRDAPKEP